MHAETKKRGWVFVGVMTLAAFVFSEIVLMILIRGREQGMSVTMALSAALAVFLCSLLIWPRVMRAGESKANGAKAGRRASLMAYPVMGALWAVAAMVANNRNFVFPKTILELLSLVVFVAFFGLLLTGWAAIPIGWIIGKWSARDFEDPDVFS